MPLLSLVVCAWVIGMVLVDAQYTPLALALAATALIIAVWMRARSIGYITVALCAGVIRMSLALSDPPPPPTLPDWYCVTARTQSWQSQQLTAVNQQHAGIQIELTHDPVLVIGDCVYLEGTLHPITSKNPSYVRQMQRQLVTHRAKLPSVIAVHAPPQWRHRLEHWRLNSVSLMQQWIREPTATIMAGMLLGIDGDVTQAVSDAFKRSGTTHMLVISGWNISIVAWLCVAVTQRIAHRVRFRMLFVIACIVIYVLAAGASAAVVRAGIMGCVAVIGKGMHRPRHAVNLIAVATFAMSCVDTSVLWDLGFQLSTLATLGLILFGESVDRVIHQSALAHPSFAWMRESIAATLAAHITTWPIMLFRLGTPSPWSILANVIAAPVVPVAMAIGTIVLILAWLLPWGMPVLHWLVYPPFLWIITCSVVMATLPAPPSWHIDAPWLELCGHAAWVGWVVVRHRHQLVATLCHDESGIVS